MPRMGSLLNVIGSSRSRSNGTAGQGTGWCILLAAMQVNYVHTYPEHWSKGFPVFFSFLFFVQWFMVESNLVRLTLLRRTCTYVVASTDR